jgi:hypothetical protein
VIRSVWAQATGSGRSLASVDTSSDAELDAARRELQERYRRLAATRPFSWSRMGDQMQIARLKRRIAQLEREGKGKDVT